MARGAAWHVLLAAGALVVGLALGGVAPRAELRAARDRLHQVDDRACAPQQGEQLANLFRGRPFPEDTPAPSPDVELEPDEPSPEQGWHSTVEVTPGDTPAAPEPDEVGTPDEAMQPMRDALEIRRTQARAALIEQAGVDDAQLEDIDTIVDDMNEDLLNLAADLAQTVGDHGEPTRREMMVFAEQTLEVLLDAEDAMVSSLDDDQLQAVEDLALDPLSHVDGRVVDALQELDR